ncbi:MAG: hypothetical protein ACRES4_00210 [Nevskiales bacterium]
MKIPLLMIIWFGVFLAIGYGAVPLMIRLFVYLHTRIGNGGHWVIRWLDTHQWQMTWGVWAVFTLGLLIALPTMLREGFFTPPPDFPTRGETRPAGAQPPLEYQTRAAQQVLVTLTRLNGEQVSFEVVSVWKAQPGTIEAGAVLRPDIRMFRLLGYAPQAGQTAVLFFTESGGLLELLPVNDYRVIYAPGDASVRRSPNLDELYQLVRENTP